jgi:hypothetical protein
MLSLLYVEIASEKIATNEDVSERDSDKVLPSCRDADVRIFGENSNSGRNRREILEEYVTYAERLKVRHQSAFGPAF